MGKKRALEARTRVAAIHWMGMNAQNRQPNKGSRVSILALRAGSVLLMSHYLSCPPTCTLNAALYMRPSNATVVGRMFYTWKALFPPH